MNKISTQLEVHTPKIAKLRTENKAWVDLTTGAVLAVMPNRPWHAESFGL
jgi:hypothetical protein